MSDVALPAVAPLPLANEATGYLAESHRPLTSLVFIAPLLVCYEAGVLLLHVQNGADAWMRRWLNLLGFSQHFLLPLLCIAILLAWHHVCHHEWRVKGRVLSAMLAECLVWAVVLWLIFRLQAVLWQLVVAQSTASLGERLCSWVGFLGAGIYEELLFRVILLSAVIWLLSATKMRRGVRLAVAIVATSLLFSLAHYVRVAGVMGETFMWGTFTFRFVAGAFFSLLFVYRGFGIAAGAHAAYDILVG